MDPRERFTAPAASYAAFRPGYPEPMVDAVLGWPPAQRAVDVGCGTGLLTRQLHARGVDVLGLDPNEAMLARARAAGGPTYRRGEAEATGLADGAVELVVAAHAFHWFDADAALAEWRRVLAPGGRAAVIFNLRARTPLLLAYEDLLARASPRAAGRLSPRAAFEALLGRGDLRAIERLASPHRQRLDREGFLGRARSSSCVAHDVDDPLALERALGALFDAHAVDGEVELELECVGLRFGLGEAFSRRR